MSKLLFYPTFILAFIIAGIVPHVVFAAAPNTFADFVNIIVGILGLILPLLVSIGLVVFLWGVVKFMASGGSEEKLEQGKNMIVYGIIAILVMISVWWLVYVLQRTFFPRTAIPPLMDNSLIDFGTPFNDRIRNVEGAS